MFSLLWLTFQTLRDIVGVLSVSRKKESSISCHLKSVQLTLFILFSALMIVMITKKGWKYGYFGSNKANMTTIFRFLRNFDDFSVNFTNIAKHFKSQQQQYWQSHLSLVILTIAKRPLNVRLVWATLMAVLWLLSNLYQKDQLTVHKYWNWLCNCLGAQKRALVLCLLFVEWLWWKYSCVYESASMLSILTIHEIPV